MPVAACSLATVVHIPPQEGELLNALEGTTGAGAGGDIDGATIDQLRYKARAGAWLSALRSLFPAVECANVSECSLRNEL